MSLYTNAIKLQQKLASKVITKDRIRKIQSVCAVDVSYKGQDAYAAAVIVDSETLQVLTHVTSRTKVKTPYVPGLMMLRESGPILSALRLLKENFDVLLVDGNGRLHPRKCGLACYIGIVLDKPTIGIAKSLLCGRILGNSVILDDEILAYTIERKKGKKIFVSIGNKISLRTAAKLTESLIKEGEWLPEPLRLADKYSKTYRNNSLIKLA
ncbi:MAG: endonuclease V [Nitrosotalea sp.]